MGLKCGIIGITNVGKTVIFNCISKTKAETSNFAFSTSKSNIGVIDVPDERLEKINSLIKSARIVPATFEIVDIPGLAKGASQGEGIGNKFLADIQQTDAIIHVLRCFDDPELPHIEGSIDPVRDMEIVDLELQVRDLDLVQLNEGWNLLPVFSNTEAAINDLFAPFSENLIMIKEVAGTSLFYPQFDIFTLTTLSPGKAYFVKVIQPFTITY
jgi:ribosome-binding ATPase YchF (GTP1/OBG family)